MKPRAFALFKVTLFFILLVAPSRSKKLHEKGSKLNHQTSHEKNLHRDVKLESNDYDEDLYNDIEHHEEQVECHKIALHKCGQIFLKAFKLLAYVSEELSFQTKCTLRTAFFNCLKKTKERSCRKYFKHSHGYETDFRRKLTDALWSTRVCVLGVKGYHSR